jgi:hypothetical protein
MFVRIGLKSLAGPNTSLSRKLVYYGRKKLYNIGPSFGGNLITLFVSQTILVQWRKILYNDEMV